MLPFVAHGMRTDELLLSAQVLPWLAVSMAGLRIGLRSKSSSNFPPSAWQTDGLLPGASTIVTSWDGPGRRS